MWLIGVTATFRDVVTKKCANQPGEQGTKCAFGVLSRSSWQGDNAKMRQSEDENATWVKSATIIFELG